jgi:hypothetical protein
MQLIIPRSCWSATGVGVLRLLLLTLLIFSTAAFAAEPIGEVAFVQGVATAQRPGEAPRFLAKGEALHESDTLNTGAKGFALITLKDGTKLTLRPNTTFTLETFRHGAGEESAIFRLVKGGVRALTGLVSKRNPRAMELNTTTATIGIRGTSFDARLCEADCAEEQGKVQRKARTVQPGLIVARIAVLSGSATATGPDGQTRNLNEGAALFTGDSVRTAKASHAVLGFRDQSKITVISDSEFKLEDVRFTGAQGEGGNFAVRIVRGGIRALTGLLAKRNPKAVTFGITTAVIGLRGTGFDAMLAPHCLAPQDCVDAAIVNTWESVVDFTARDRALPIETGRVGIYIPARDLLTLLDAIPPVIQQEPAPRPDAVDINFDALFAAVELDTFGRGLFVGMREGDIVLRGPGGFIYLSRDEAGFLQDGAGTPLRVTPFPIFLLNDPVPTPESFDERSFRLLELLNPGDVICEIR